VQRFLAVVHPGLAAAAHQQHARRQGVAGRVQIVNTEVLELLGPAAPVPDQGHVGGGGAIGQGLQGREAAPAGVALDQADQVLAQLGRRQDCLAGGAAMDGPAVRCWWHEP